MITEKYSFVNQEDRKNKINSYLHNYHPLAYSTSVKIWETFEEGVKMYFVEFKRGSSAD